MRKVILAGLFSVVATAAFAQMTTSTEYYVVRDATTKKCTIVDKKPTTTTTTTTVVGDTVYRTKTEAETGMKQVKVCTSDAE